MKAVIFDLDGVLVDACEWHYISLNKALSSVVGINITKEEHENKYNALPTTKKLDLLGVSKDDAKKIWKLKQEVTIQTIKDNISIDHEKIELHNSLRSRGLKIACVTNSIRKTTELMLEMSGQINLIDYIMTNEDVLRNKPFPDCYNKMVTEVLGADPKKCIVVEDSPKGIQAAKESVVPDENIWDVKNSKEVTIKGFNKFYENLNTNGW